MLRVVIAFCVLLSAVPACRPRPKDADPAATGGAATTEGSTYGEALQGVPLTPLGELMANPEKYQGKTVGVRASVERACSAKGCWMELGADGASCRVTFKDYGFFVPTDSAGSRALVEGTVVVKTVEASHVAHLEGEGATFANKNADGTANEVQLVATGVQLSRP